MRGMARLGSAVDVLVRFAHVVSGELEPEQTHRALVDAVVEDLSAAAAGVFSVTPDGGVRLVASRNLPAGVEALESDGVGPELGEAVQRAGQGRFEAVDVLPMVSGGDLVGALVVAYEQGGALEPEARELLQGLLDLAAVAQRTAAQVQELRRSNAELRAARRALGQAEKLNSLGQMAAGIAHDLANVFAPLVGDVENMRARGPEDERTVKALNRMSRYLRVGTEMVERLRRFARQTPEAAGHAAADPTQAIKDAVEMAQAKGRSLRVEVRHQLEPLPPVVVSQSDLTACLVNLIVNAIDAQPQGGVVEVRAGPDPRGGAWIEVADQGPGIPEELQERIFEPFFTTKAERGTGLGLANAYAFVQRHRGTIGFTTAPGQGTTFRIELPAATHA